MIAMNRLWAILEVRSDDAHPGDALDSLQQSYELTDDPELRAALQSLADWLVADEPENWEHDIKAMTERAIAESLDGSE